MYNQFGARIDKIHNIRGEEREASINQPILAAEHDTSHKFLSYFHFHFYFNQHTIKETLYAHTRQNALL